MNSLKTGLYVGFLSLSLGIALGRYTNRNVTSTTDTVKDVNSSQDTKKVTVIITAPDGKKTTTETTEVATHHEVDTKKITDVQLKPIKPSLNVSALASFDVNKRFEPVYGFSISREILGPVTLGAFGLTNGVVGLSLGVNF